MKNFFTQKRLWIPLSLTVLGGIFLWITPSGPEEQREVESPLASSPAGEKRLAEAGDRAPVADIPASDPAGDSGAGFPGERRTLSADFGLQDGEVVTGTFLRRQAQRKALPLVEIREDLESVRRLDDLRAGADLLQVGWSEPNEEGYQRRVTILEFPGDHLGPIRLEEMVSHPMAGMEERGTAEGSPGGPYPEILVMREDSAQYLTVQVEGEDGARTLEKLQRVLSAEYDRMISSVGLHRLRLKDITLDGVPEAVEASRGIAETHGGVRLVEEDSLKRVADEAGKTPVYPYPEEVVGTVFVMSPEERAKHWPPHFPRHPEAMQGTHEAGPGWGETETNEGGNFRDSALLEGGLMEEMEMDVEPLGEETLPPGMGSKFYDEVYAQMVQMHAPEAWTVRNSAVRDSGETIVVGVLDTGVSLSHPDMVGNLWVNPNPGINAMGIQDDIHGVDLIKRTGNPDDIQTTHGTHVAGTVGADGTNGEGIAGVAWEVDIMALRFLGPNGGWGSDAIAGLDYMIEMGAHVGNHSWGGSTYMESLKEAFDRQTSNDIISSVAAGNHHQNTHHAPLYPSFYSVNNKGIVTVMSATKRETSLPGTNTPTGGKDFFSSYGTATQIGAHGVNIYSLNSLWEEDGNLYRRMSGTSMAAPHVAGAMALLRAEFPDLDVIGIRERILKTSDWSNDLAGFNLVSGMINLYRALTEDPDEHLTVAMHIRPNPMDELSTGGFGVPSSGPLEGLTRGHYLAGSTFPVGVTIYGFTDYGEWEEGDLEVELVASMEVVPISPGEEVPEIEDKVITLSPPTEIDRFLLNSGFELPGYTGSLVFVTLTLTVSGEGYDTVVRELVVSSETAPENDAYSTAIYIPIEGGSYTTNNRYAWTDFNWGDGPHDYEAFGDPLFIAGYRSYKQLWWKWTPKYDTVAEVNTYGSEHLPDAMPQDMTWWTEEYGYDTLLAVMTGTWPKETLYTVGANRLNDQWPDVPGVKRNWSRVVFEAKAGVEYTFVVGGHYSYPGGVNLNLIPNYPAPVVKEEPPVQVTGILGRPIDISATVLWAETYEWRREGMIGLPDGPQPDGATLSFESLEMGHAGTYTLHAFNPYGETATREVHLRVIDPAGIGDWATFNPWPTPHGLGGLARGPEDEQIAVGGSGTLLRQTEDSEWTAVPLGIAQSLSDIVYDAGRDRYVVVGDEGIILTGDGLAWETHQIDGQPRLRSLALGDGDFVAVGGVLDAGVILYSENGDDWTDVTPSGLTDVLYDVAWNGSVFVAVGGDPATGQGALWQSGDGQTWQVQASGQEALLYGLDWWQDAWTVVGGNDAGAVLYRGSNAAALSPVSVDSPEPLYAVGSNDEWQAAVGEMGRMAISTDGNTWQWVESGTPYALKAVYGAEGSMEVAGDVGVILHSENGEDWSGGWGHRQTMETVATIPQKNRLTAVGDSSTALVSAEGSDWNVWSIGEEANRYFALYFDADAEELIAVGEFGSVATSREHFATTPTLDGGEEVVQTAIYGQEWEEQVSNQTLHLRGVTGNGQDYIAVGSRGLIVRSEGRNGIWSKMSSPTSQRLNDVLWTGEEYLAVGNQGTLLRSVTGQNWQPLAAPVGEDLFAIAPFAGRYYITADAGKILHSADLQNWSVVDLETEDGLFGLASGGGQLVAVGERGALFSSADGKNWDAHFSGVRTSLYGAVYQDERFIVVGSMGTVLSANPLPTVEPVVLDPEEDIHPETITASLSTATEGASIYYTLDGTRPDENATLYTNPFEVEEPTLVRARAFAEDHEPSGITDRQLIIGDAPFITVHPVSHAAALGGSTTFSVEVMGEEPFTYQWYRGETELEEATSRTLPLDNLSEADAGTYRVAVSNTFGSVESEEAELTLMEGPSILSQPEDQYAYFGQTLTLELAVSGGGPFTYEWQKDDETIHQGSQAQLTIPSVSSFDVGRYRVIVRNAVGTAVSDPFMLYVNDEPEAPSIVGQPVDAEGLSGEPVHLEVAATGSLPMEYTWYHDGEVVSSSTSPVLTLAASAETVGTYWVKVENAYGEEMSETAQLGLIEEGSLLDLVLVNPGRSEVAIPEGMGLVLSAEITEYGENTGALGLRWEKVEGPGEVHFGDPMHTQTTARFASEGKYQLRLHAWNALAEDFLDVEVLVVETSALDTGLTGYPGNELYLPLENYFLTGVVGETEVSDKSLKLSNTEGLGQQGVVLNFTKGDFRLDQVGDKIRASFNWRQNRSTSTSRLANSFAWGFFSGSEADQNHWDQHHDWAGFFHHIPSTMGSQSTASYSFGMQIPNLDLFHSASYTTSNFFSKSGLPPQANQTFPVVLTIERVRLEGEEYVEMTSRFPVSHSSAINLSGVETTREVIWSLHKPSGAGEILTVKSAYPLEYAMTEFSGIGFSNREHNTIEGFEISDLLIEPVRGGLTFENIGPLVEFTADEVSIPVDQSYELVAQVQDDGLPRVPGSVSSLWQQISGETLTLPQPHALETDIHPETVGMRTFRLYADDGEITTFAEKRVGVSTDGEHLPPEFLTEALPDGVEGSAYEALLETSGGAGSLTLSLEDGPAWLNLSDAGDGTALLNGTPSEAGDVSLVVSVSDGIDTVSQTFTLAVLPDGSVPGLPVLSLGEPADIGISSAKLAANLEAGATPVYLELYVGLVDEGENAGAWDQHLTIGYRNHGTYVKEAPGLEPGTLYFYRFVATNEVGTRWSETGEFVTSGGPVGMSYTIRFPGYPGEGPVQEYPLLVRLAEGLGGFSYAELAYPESGADLRFYDEALNELPFEIEQWNEDGESTVWVQVPELDAATKLTMVVGDPSRDALPAYAMDGSIWETHFDSVWHLGEAAGEPRADATPQGADVVSTGSSPVAQVPGIVGYAAGFDGSGGNSRLETTGAELLPVHQLTNRFSLEGWIYIDPSVNNHDDNRYWRLLSQDSQWSNGAGYSSSLLSANRFDFSIGVSPGLGSGNGRKRLMSEMDGVFPEVPYGEWIYLSTTWDGNILRQYINGVKVGEDLGFNHSIAYAENPSPLRLGANEDRSLAGRLDEVRFSHEPKSADWVRTTYVNIAETEYFLTIEPRMTGGDRPAFLTRAEPQAIVGEEYDEEIKLYAKDADSLSLDAEGLPAWLTLEGTDNPRTYVLRGTPSVDDLGSSAITLTATNDAGEAEQNFVLWVYPEGTLAGLPDFGPLQVLERGVYEATLGADLQVGDEPVEVWLWYGRENGGDQPESWEHRYRFPEQKVGMFAHQVENLEEETLYYFRFFAENEVGSVQTESLAFSTRRDLTEIYPVAHLENPGVSNVRIPSGVGLVLEAEVEEAGGVSDSLVYLWESLSGPATVAWEASDSRETVAWFPENGSYVLRFTADNSVNADSFEVEVEVVDPALIDGNSG
ncbi:MAG: DUF2341 domain-containing protein, partial [Opitutales bacterium]|nr:DUF2341 domain-containing protein [Opitutales bacterium]